MIWEVMGEWDLALSLTFFQHFESIVEGSSQGDLPSIDEVYGIGILDRTQSVSDDHLRRTRWEFLEDGFEEELSHRIDIRGRLIEYEDLGLPEVGSDKCDELFLSEAHGLGSWHDPCCEAIFELREDAEEV